MSVARALADWIGLDRTFGPLLALARERLGSDHVSSEALRAIGRRFRTSRRDEDDCAYDRYHAEFFLRYSKTNALKLYYGALPLRQLGYAPRIRRVADLGAGAGSSTLALLMHHFDCEGSARLRLDHVRMVDTSDPALGLGAEVINEYLAQLGHPESAPRIESEQTEVTPRLIRSLDADLLVFGHSLMEVLRSGARAREYAAAIAESGSAILVVDRSFGPRDWETVNEFVNRLLPRYRVVRLYRWPGRGPLDLADLGAIRHDWAGIMPQGTPRESQVSFMQALLVPCEWQRPAPVSDAVTVMQRYRTAWERHDVDLLSSIFHDSATYREKAGSVFCGVEEIRDYWVENAARQREVEFCMRLLLDSSRVSRVFWTCSFRRRDLLNTRLALDGEMRLQTSGGRVMGFWEEFEKNRLDHESPINGGRRESKKPRVHQ